MAIEITVQPDERVIVPVFEDIGDIRGEISVRLVVPGLKVEHNGINVKIYGRIEVLYDHSKDIDFLDREYELVGPGEINRNRTYRYAFFAVKMPYGTYHGINVNLRYILEVTMNTIEDGIIVKNNEFLVQHCSSPPLDNSPFKLENNFKGVFYVEAMFDRDKYHLNDVIKCRLNFFIPSEMNVHSVRIQLNRRESTFKETATPNFGFHTPFNLVEYTTLASTVYDINALTETGVSISRPIDIELSNCDLTPSIQSILNRFRVEYCIQLDIIRFSTDEGANEEDCEAMDEGANEEDCEAMDEGANEEDCEAMDEGTNVDYASEGSDTDEDDSGFESFDTNEAEDDVETLDIKDITLYRRLA